MYKNILNMQAFKNKIFKRNKIVIKKYNKNF